LDGVTEPRQAGPQAVTDAFWLVLTAYLSQFLTLGLAFVLRRQLGPVGMGYVAIVTLVATYAPYASLGTIQAAEREIAIAIGRGNEAEAESLEAAGSRVALLFALVAACVVAAVGIVRGSTDHLLGATLLCAAAVLLLQQLGVWATLRLRTRYRFRSLGWITAFTAVATALLNVVGATVGGTVGTLIAIGLGSLLAAVLMAAVAGVGRVSIHRRGVIHGLAVLAPGFLASGAASLVLGSIDQLAVGFLLGTTSLGLYSAAYLGYGFVLRVPTLIGSVIYPRLQRKLGASNDRARVFAMVARTTAIVAVAMPAMVAVFYVALPALVYLILPEFRQAVDPMRLLLVGLVGFAFGMPATQYLITVNRQWLQVAISGAFLVGMASAYLAASATGHMSLLVAAGVDAVGYYAYGITMQIAAHRVAGVPLRAMLSLMPIHALTAVELLLGAVLTGALLGSAGATGIILGAVAQAILFGACWLALAAAFAHSHDGARDDMRLLLDLMREGLTWIRRVVLRSIV